MATAQQSVKSSVFAGRIAQFGRGTPFIHAPITRVTSNTIAISGTRRAVATNVASTKPALPRTSKSSVLQRQIIKAPPVTVQKKVRSQKSLGQKMLIGMAMMVFMAGIAVALLQLRTNHEVIAQVRQGTAVLHANTEEQSVSEEEPTPAAIAAYRTDPGSPRFIRIPSLKVNARVQRQGLDKNGALKAPGNVYNAGWYENSSKPGEGGAVLLDGHVAGPTKRGVFYDIKKLKPGDVVQLERGDSKIFNYKVVKSVTTDADKTDMSAALLSVQEGKAGLNLMTCTGQYDHKSGEYNQRITVFAVQI